MATDEVHVEPLKDEIRNLLEEARMVLPGLQALFGFQMIAVFNDTFKTLEAVWQTTHLAGSCFRWSYAVFGHGLKARR